MKEKNTYIFIISILCFMTLACKNNLFTIEKESNSNKAYVSFSDTGIGRAADNAPDFFQSENLDEESVTKVVFIAKTSNDEKIINKEFTPDIENKRNAVEVFKKQLFEFDEGTYDFSADFYALDVTSKESEYPVLTASIQNQELLAGNSYHIPLEAHYLEYGDIQIKYYWEPDITNDEPTEQIKYVEMSLFALNNLDEPVEASEENVEVVYDENSDTYSVTYLKLHVPCGDYFLKALLYNSYEEEDGEKYGVDRLGIIQSFVKNSGNKIVDERFIKFEEYDKLYSIHYDLRGGSWNEEDAWHKYVNTFNPLIQKNLTSASLASGISKIENSEGQLKDIQWKMTSWYEVQSDKAVTLTPLLIQDENNNYTGGDYYLYAKWSLPYCYVYSLENLDGTYEEYYPEQIRERRKECPQEELITKKADFEEFISNIATDDFNEEELQPGFEKCTEDFATWDIYNYLGSLIVKVAYKCNRKTVTNTYICNAKEDDANFQNTIEKTGKYGAEISTVEPVEYEGYNFICWEKEVSENTFENCELPSEFGTDDAVYYAVYEKKTYPSSGTIASDNRALLISLDYDPETISLDNGEITFVATKADGSELTEEEAESITWTAEILYKGNDINSFNEEIDYYFVEGNCLSWNAETPLPSAANYQIYVTATWPVTDENSAVTMSNSQTFDINIQ